ncbi:unnamed protein product [Linum tenue]|nr:unnamed protein product [Linum tenue]
MVPEEAAGIESGSSRPGHRAASSVTLKHVYLIAKVKQSDPYCQHMSLESICMSASVRPTPWGLRSSRN